MTRVMVKSLAFMRGMRRALATFLGVAAIAGLVASLALVAPLPPEMRASLFRAALVDQPSPPALAPGASGTYTLGFRNVGLAPWRRGVDGMEVRLGIDGDAAKYASLRGDGWISVDRAATTNEALVLPGAVGTFTVGIRAPDVAGAYTLPLRPVV